MKNEGLSVGQKIKTPFALCIPSSRFHTSEGKRMMHSDDNAPLCFYSVCFCATLGFAVILSVIIYCCRSNLSVFPISGYAADALCAVTASSVLFAGGFVSYVFYSASLRYAFSIQCGVAKSGNDLVFGKDALKRAFRSYAVTLLFCSAPLCLCALSISIFAKTEEFTAIIGIICGIMILTSLYLLCIIKCVATVYLCTDSLQYTLHALHGNLMQYVCLCIRLVPHTVLAISSFGILVPFYVMPYSLLCRGSFAAYIHTAQGCAYSYDPELQKGRNSNGE